ncbi:extracellular solute-binding protein [Candidatus Poribacteria bacterium]|nr:extracellular solute-binding protein [Candidatus Poribacteria bacterium]
MKKFLIVLMALFVVFAACAKKEKSITIVWAEWDPANYLDTLAKDFTAETGIKVTVSQIPWANFQEKVFMALKSKSGVYDIIIGDSQWLGQGAIEGHYVDLTDWMKANIDIASVSETAMTAFAEYPKGSQKYWALPAEVDCNGFAYRTDLFENPNEQAAFKAKYGYDLAPPETYDQLRDIAEFFTRPPDLYGIAPWFTKAYDGITMGFQQVMWTFGGSYGDEQTYKVEGILNSEAGVKALEYYKGLKQFAPEGSVEYYWAEALDAFKKGLVAMAMDYFAFFPGLVSQETNPAHYNHIGFFVAPGQTGPDGQYRRYISIGGQGMSICSYSKNQNEAKQFLKWFIQKPVQEKWAQLGGFTPHKEVLKSDAFLNATPYNKAFSDSFPYLRDFWAVPEYAELIEVCQTNWNAAIVGTITPKEAMDTVTKEHERIFREAGYYK